MKKFLLFVFSMLIFVSINASNSSLFSYDKNQVESEFTDLSQLENFVVSNEGITLNQIFEDSEGMLANLNLNVTSPLKPMFSFDDMDWGAFAWGFCCCPIGFFVVAINKDKTQEQKTSYWLGVLVSSVISLISNLATPSYY